jgi:protein phosphatase
MIDTLELNRTKAQQRDADRASGTGLVVRSFGLTDQGKVRPTNQDQFLIAALRKALEVETSSLPVPRLQYGSDQSHLFMIADGMGGHAGGETASALAVDSIEAFVLDTVQWFSHFRDKEQDQPLTDLQRALDHANHRVIAEAAERPELHGMGTTVTLAYHLNDMLFVAHVGDSRCYLLRSDRLHLLTHDHTLVDQMVRQGLLSPAEAEQNPWKHVITNVVGGDSSAVEVEVHRVHLQARDVMLLCSDGLNNMVSDDEIQRELQDSTDPEAACRALVALANERGSPDNVTVVIARFEHDQTKHGMRWTD